MPHPTDGGEVESWAAGWALDRILFHSQILFPCTELSEGPSRVAASWGRRGACGPSGPSGLRLNTISALSAHLLANASPVTGAASRSKFRPEVDGLNYLRGGEGSRHA